MFRRILDCASRETSKIAFLEEILKMLMVFSGCDSTAFLMEDGKKYHCFKSDKKSGDSLDFDIINLTHGQKYLEEMKYLRKWARGISGFSPFFYYKDGGLWVNNTSEFLNECPDPIVDILKKLIPSVSSYPSVALLPIEVDSSHAGVLQLGSRKAYHFKETETDIYKGIIQSIGTALKVWQVQSALNERVKELTCHYNILQLSDQPDRTLDEIFKGVVELLPPAWQFPDAATARIVFDGKVYALPDFQKAKQRQSSYIIVKGKKRGFIEVAYTEDKPELDEGPFLKEERELIESVSKELSLIILRRVNEEEKSELLDQLRHADRLAIIGQLAAAVAHELNEPLANILGFSQLALKSEGVPEQTRQDIEKISAASLHSREIIKKLLAFARQTPSKKSPVRLNQVVKETLYFLDSRCTKEGIAMKLCLDPDIPDIIANAGQLMQVLTNLVVNSMQAMQKGGNITIRTLKNLDYVILVVEDNGIGMSEDVKGKIFTPFFTNKAPGHGTGLGLPVVHDIIMAHGGSMTVESDVGQGTRFEIRLPVRRPERTGTDD